MSDLVLARNCCLARMLTGEAENGVGMNRSVREGKNCEALRGSHGLDTALYKNYLLLIISDDWFKDKIYKTIVKTAMIYGSECWAVKKNDTTKLHTTEMRMLRWARGKTKKDHIKNEESGEKPTLNQ